MGWGGQLCMFNKLCLKTTLRLLLMSFSLETNKNGTNAQIRVLGPLATIPWRLLGVSVPRLHLTH